MAARITIRGDGLSVEEVHRVARSGARVSLSTTAKRNIRRGRKCHERLLRRGSIVGGSAAAGASRPPYGGGPVTAVPTGPEEPLGKQIVHAHVAGTGDPQPEDVVRAAILCRINTFAKGNGAASLDLVSALVELLNRGVTPLIYEKGPVGTTGTMAQVAEVLMGSGEAFHRGELLPSALAMKKAGLEFLSPTLREGLNLMNGPHLMSGELALRCFDVQRLLKNAVVASAMTIDALRVPRTVFDPRLNELRPFRGQGAVAESIRRTIAESEIAQHDTEREADAHSLQCAPQILGPTLDALDYVTGQVQIEMNAASDDTIIIAEENRNLRGAHPHGQALAMAADFLSIAVAEAASMSERHINRLLNPALSGLPGFLVEGEGLITGLVSAQYAAASLVSENRVLAHPGVVDSISISADREDHVSMGPVAIRKLRGIVSNTTAVVAIEMLCAAQALDFRKPQRPGRGVRAAYRTVRRVVPRLTSDRPLYPDIQNVTRLVEDGAVVRAVERAVGSIAPSGDAARIPAHVPRLGER